MECDLAGPHVLHGVLPSAATFSPPLRVVFVPGTARIRAATGQGGCNSKPSTKLPSTEITHSAWLPDAPWCDSTLSRRVLLAPASRSATPQDPIVARLACTKEARMMLECKMLRAAAPTGARRSRQPSARPVTRQALVVRAHGNHPHGQGHGHGHPHGSPHGTATATSTPSEKDRGADDSGRPFWVVHAITTAHNPPSRTCLSSDMRTRHRNA